jgi:hypothetical protein
MSYVKKNNICIGDTVILTRKVKSSSGFFTKGSIVEITDIDSIRVYKNTL